MSVAMSFLVKNTAHYPYLRKQYYGEMAKLINDYSCMRKYFGISSLQQQKQYFINEKRLKNFEHVMRRCDSYRRFGKPRFSVIFVPENCIELLCKLLASLPFAEDLLLDNVNEYITLATELIESYDVIAKNLKLFTAAPSFKDDSISSDSIYIVEIGEKDLLSKCPDEIIAYIFSFLTEMDLFSMRLVSKRMKQLSEVSIKKIPKKFTVTEKTGIIPLYLKSCLFGDVHTIEFKPSKPEARYNVEKKISFSGVCKVMGENMLKVKRLKFSTPIDDRDDNIPMQYLANVSSLKLKSFYIFKQYRNLLIYLHNLQKLSLRLIYFRAADDNDDHGNDEEGEEGRLVLPMNLRVLKIVSCSLIANALVMNT
ncbi:hypothetical protein B4U79_16927, partial [Dinothrombium tinctorium]